MSWTSLFSEDAALVLDDIVGYIGRYDSPDRSNHVLEQIELGILSQSEHPCRSA